MRRTPPQMVSPGRLKPFATPAVSCWQRRNTAMEDLVPLFGIFIPLSAIVLGIGLSFWQVYWNHQKRQLQYRERQLMIEKGMTPPPVLVEEERKSASPEGSLRRGIVL